MANRLMLALLVVMACTKSPQPATQTQTAPAPEPPRAEGPRVTLPDGFVVRLEIAADDETRAQGLMYRDRLPPGTGMLFMFAQDGNYPFWMKNTIIPLDMIWIDTAHRVVHIHHDVPPCRADPCPSYPPSGTSRYVLELAGGQARAHGLKAGDQLRIEGIEQIVAR